MNIFDPGWSDFVLSKLTENEYFKGKPKLSGLRRITEELLGKIVFSGPINQALEPSYASVVYEIKIKDFLGELLTFRGLADAHAGSVEDKFFQKFYGTLAENRAESRALRKALQINVVVHEECEPIYEIEPISQSQLLSIQARCGKIGVDYNKLNVNKLNKEQALELINTLKGYEQNHHLIPKEILL